MNEEQAEKPEEKPEEKPGEKPIELPGKKSRWWIWLIIALIVIGAGGGIYLWLSSGGGIPTPPALPS